MPLSAALISGDHFPAVRAALDVTLDADALPDSIIQQDIFWGAAERQVYARDPLAVSRTGDDLLRIWAACVYLTAARLAPQMPNIIGEKFGSYSQQLQAKDWLAHAAYLRSQAEEQLAEVLGEDTADAMPPFFTVAAGRRGL